MCLCAYAISHTTAASSIVQPPSSCTQVISALRLSSLTFRQPLLHSRRPESSVSSARLKPKIFAELSIPQTRTQDARQHQNTSEKPRPPPTQQHNTPRQGAPGEGPHCTPETNWAFSCAQPIFHCNLGKVPALPAARPVPSVARDQAGAEPTPAAVSIISKLSKYSAKSSFPSSSTSSVSINTSICSSVRRPWGVQIMSEDASQQRCRR